MPTDAPTPDPSERPEVEPLSAERIAHLRQWHEAPGHDRAWGERSLCTWCLAFATISTLTAERDALSAEVERLRGIVEAASERHFIEYPSASDETWQTNARCACGASLLCTELVALAALHPVSEEGPPAAPEAPTGPVLGVCDTFPSLPHQRDLNCPNWRPVAPEGTEGEK